MTDLKKKSVHFIALAEAATPGPLGELNYVVYASSKPGIFDTEIAHCATDDCDLSHDECEANARLFAAAPDMAQHIAALQAENDALRGHLIEISAMVPETHHARGFSTNALVGLLEGIGRTADDAINRERGG